MKKYPPYVAKEDRVILFDATCKLCHGWSRFIIQYDKQHRYKLCSVQSSPGKAILAYFGLSTEFVETMALVEGSTCFQKSDAFFQVMSGLGYPWKAVFPLSWIPPSIRDWCYDRVALNRYRLFGKYDVCLLPDADHCHRFLDEN